MTRGPYAGIVFFQPSDNKQTMTVTANATGITGTIYAPAAALSESGNGAINASLIVDRLGIEGSESAGASTLTNTKGAIEDQGLHAGLVTTQSGRVQWRSGPGIWSPPRRTFART